MAGMGPMLAALQFGSAVGHLARTTLGQYEIPIWRRRPALLVVPGNLRRFAEDWSLPLDDVSLWVCLREVTTHAVLGRPHVRDRIAELLRDVVGGMAGEAAGAVERLQQLDPGDPEALTSLFSDPERLMGEPSPERLRASAELTAVIAALLGYVEHVLDGTATRLLGGRGALAEAWRRRQVDRESPSRTAEMLFGLDLGPATVAQGVEFVSGVLSRAGEDGLGRLWSSRATLPTPAELSAPGLWLERTSYGEDAEDGGT
jgi:putative hydrolase